MADFNKTLLMGRLTRSPELRYTTSGKAVSDVSLAINREFTAGDEKRKDTTFVDVTLWGKQAELVCRYLKKGSPIFIEGRLQLDRWEDSDGREQRKLKVVADTFQFLGSAAGKASADSAPGEEVKENAEAEAPLSTPAF